jgi:hypothetical protein
VRKVGGGLGDGQGHLAGPVPAQADAPGQGGGSPRPGELIAEPGHVLAVQQSAVHPATPRPVRTAVHLPWVRATAPAGRVVP